MNHLFTVSCRSQFYYFIISDFQITSEVKQKKFTSSPLPEINDNEVDLPKSNVWTLVNILFGYFWRLTYLPLINFLSLRSNRVNIITINN